MESTGESPSPILIPGRSCGTCALCCKLGEIPNFKPFNQWCRFCSTHQRCDIYAERPKPCSDFFCHYLLSDLGEEWWPARCGMVVSAYSNPSRLTVSVDPDHPEDWQREPYLTQIMHWANFGAVTVQVGKHVYAAYTDRIEDLGEQTPENRLMIFEQETQAGIRYVTRLMKLDEPLT